MGDSVRRDEPKDTVSILVMDILKAATDLLDILNDQAEANGTHRRASRSGIMARGVVVIEGMERRPLVRVSTAVRIQILVDCAVVVVDSPKVWDMGRY